jgi:N-acetylglucosamine-6-sulfatase
MLTMKSQRFILARPDPSVLYAWTKISVVCRGVTTLSLLSVVLLGTIVFTAPSRLAAQAATANRPNIIVIMIDDQRLDDLRVMPKTRALIGSGTTFANYYVTLPTCCPSRATFLTGQYPHNHEVMSNSAPSGGYTKLDHSNTLPLWLQQAGYYTSYIGKYLNGYPPAGNETEIPPGWNDWQALLSGAQLYNYTINDNGVLVTYGSTAADYSTDVLAARAETTIVELVAKQPFFLTVGSDAPHDERQLISWANPRPAPRHLGIFADEPLPQPPSFNEADVLDKPTDIRNLAPINSPALEEITARYRSRLESLLAIDDLVERIVNTLLSYNILGNTVLIFTSDNGWFQGEHRIKKGKGIIYEEAIHVPLLIRGGGFPQGVTTSQITANTDLAPTIVGLAHAKPRLPMDGRSLLPLALNSSIGRGRHLLLETQTQEGVYNGSFLYVEHKKTGEQELYDMRPGSTNYDPYQLQSRHADPAYAGVEAQLSIKLNQLRTCSGISCQVQ